MSDFGPRRQFKEIYRARIVFNARCENSRRPVTAMAVSLSATSRSTYSFKRLRRNGQWAFSAIGISHSSANSDLAGKHGIRISKLDTNLNDRNA